MTSVQRIIKYLAIAFAGFLIFTIFSGIITIIGGIGGIFNKENTTIIDKKELNNLTSYLDINLKKSTLNIKKSNRLYVEVSSDDIKVIEDGNKITIEDKSKNNIFSFSKETVNLYIPEDYKYDLININTGAGDMNIEYLNTKKLVLDLGAGKTSIDTLYSDDTNIETGAGSLSISGGEIGNANIDLGVGKIDIKAKVYGKNKIESGIGSVKLSLIDNDYKFTIDKGIGSISFNGDKIKSDSTIGTGENTIDINGGVGSITIDILK